MNSRVTCFTFFTLFERQNNGLPKDLISGTCYYVTLHGKGTWKIKFKDLGDGQIILDYLSGPDLIK